MHVFFIGRKFLRIISITVILLLTLLLLQYYTFMALNPQRVHFREPRGEAIKVSVDGVEDEKNEIYDRFLNFLNEFFQNGL